MTIELISQEENAQLVAIYESTPALFLQSKGYEYISKSKLTEDETNQWTEVEKILRKAIKGFSKFSNFRLNRSNELQVRFQYDWSADTPGITFIGVGYLTVAELMNGFNDTPHGE